MKKIVRLTEQDLHNIVKESVKRIINNKKNMVSEGFLDRFFKYKNEDNNIEKNIRNVFNCRYTYESMLGHFGKYMKYAQSGNNEPNQRIELGGRRGFHGGTFYYYCTDSEGNPFFYPDLSGSNTPSIKYLSNDELAKYFPKTRQELVELMKKYTPNISPYVFNKEYDVND